MENQEIEKRTTPAIVDPNLEAVTGIVEVAVNAFNSAMEQKAKEDETARIVRMKQLENENKKDHRTKTYGIILAVLCLIALVILALMDKIEGTPGTILAGLLTFSAANLGLSKGNNKSA